jgi:hypothetical protein
MSDEFQVIFQHLEIGGYALVWSRSFALLLSFKYGSPEAIQEFVVRESSRNQQLLA